MARQPDKYLVKDIKAWDTDRETRKGQWVPARPHGHNAFGFTWRFKLAWDVLTGKADALFWDEESELEIADCGCRFERSRSNAVNLCASCSLLPCHNK